MIGSCQLSFCTQISLGPHKITIILIQHWNIPFYTAMHQLFDQASNHPLLHSIKQTLQHSIEPYTSTQHQTICSSKSKRVASIPFWGTPKARSTSTWSLSVCNAKFPHKNACVCPRHSLFLRWLLCASVPREQYREKELGRLCSIGAIFSLPPN